MLAPFTPTTHRPFRRRAEARCRASCRWRLGLPRRCVGRRGLSRCRFGWCLRRSGVRARRLARAGRLRGRAVAAVARVARRRRGGCGSGTRLGVALDGVAALVHEPMVLVTEQHEVLEARLAAVRPVLAVVRLQVPAGARSRGNSRCGRRAPRAAGAARQAPCGGCDRHSRGRPSRSICATTSASQPSRRAVSGEISGPSSSSRATTTVGAERGRVDMNDNARPLAATARRRRQATPRRDRAAPRPAQDAEGRQHAASPPTSGGLARPAPGPDSASTSGSACAPLGVARSPPTRSSRRRSSTRSRAASSALHQQHAVLGREPRPQKQRAVVVEVVVDVLQLVRTPRASSAATRRKARSARSSCDAVNAPARSSSPSSDDAVATLVNARTFENVSSPRPNAARINGSSCNASATRRNSRASRPVIPHRHATNARRSLLSPCSRISHTSSSQRAVAALRCADRLASSSTRARVAASRAATSSRTRSIDNVASIENTIPTPSDDIPTRRPLCPEPSNCHDGAERRGVPRAVHARPGGRVPQSRQLRCGAPAGVRVPGDAPARARERAGAVPRPPAPGPPREGAREHRPVRERRVGRRDRARPQRDDRAERCRPQPHPSPRRRDPPHRPRVRSQEDHVGRGRRRAPAPGSSSHRSPVRRAPRTSSSLRSRARFTQTNPCPLRRATSPR